MFAMPHRNMRLRPRRSPSRPKGSKNAALANRYAMGIQLVTMASVRNSRAMTGMATFTADNIRGLMKAPRQTTISAVLCKVCSEISGLAISRSDTPPPNRTPTR